MAYIGGLVAPVDGNYTGTTESERRIENNRWFDLTGARFVVLPPDMEPPGPQFVSVYEGEVRIFENRRAFPRVFLTPAIRSVRDRVRALEVLQQEAGFDPVRTGLVEGPLPDG